MTKHWTVKQVTRKDFTYEEISKALQESRNKLPRAAHLLSNLGKGKVTRQLLRYWVQQEDFNGADEPHSQAEQVVARHRVQKRNTELTRDNKLLADVVQNQAEFEYGIELALERLNRTAPIQFDFQNNHNGTGLTVEILLSDWQVGKLSSTYNTEIAKKRMFEFGRAARMAIQQKVDNGYKIDKIILAMLGDIIESDEKHANSGRACDSSTAEQLADSIECIYSFMVEPLASLNVPTEVFCVAGNHDWNGHGLNMFKTGRTQLSYPLYTALRLITEKVFDNVKFVIPEGVFAVADIYGSKVLYEHGVGVAVTEAAMKTRKTQRTEQLGQFIHYFRMGDKHTVCSFNNHQYVVNGAFFGTGTDGSEYSEIAGYSSQAGQWMGFHCERDDERTTLFDTFVVQLGHIK